MMRSGECSRKPLQFFFIKPTGVNDPLCRPKVAHFLRFVDVPNPARGGISELDGRYGTYRDLSL